MSPKSIPKHSPTPWHKGSPHPDIKATQVVLFDKHGYEDGLIAEFLSENDADYAIRAVNSHDELVEAINGLMSAHEAENTEMSLAIGMAICKLRAALLKAQGRE